MTKSLINEFLKKEKLSCNFFLMKKSLLNFFSKKKRRKISETEFHSSVLNFRSFASNSQNSASIFRKNSKKTNFPDDQVSFFVLIHLNLLQYFFYGINVHF